MKLILTGCTGFIGSEVLAQCLQNPLITSVVALSRRELPRSEKKNPKLKILVVKDFNSYPFPVLQELSGADACIWCMGTTIGDRALEVDYPLAFATAYSRTVSDSKKKFRYIHLSGGVTERDQQRSLWFKPAMRKMKGENEVNMLGFAAHPSLKGLWSTLIAKAPFVAHKEITGPRDVVGWMLGGKAIVVDELAAVMIDAALQGWEGNTIEDSAVMVSKGRELLGKV